MSEGQASVMLYEPARLAVALEEAGLDALLMTSGANVRYLTRFTKPGTALAIVLREEPAHPHLMVPAVDLDYLVEDHSPAVGVTVWGDFVRFRSDGIALGPLEHLVHTHHEAREPDLDRGGMLARQVDCLGLRGARIGLDVDPAAQRELVDALGDTRLVDASHIVARLRMRKSPAEVTRLREAARVAESAIRSTAAVAAPGVSQGDLATEFRVIVAREGALLRVDSVSVGRSSVFGNAAVRTDVLQEGDLLRFDVGAIHLGYQSDLARTFAVGDPGEKARSYYAAVVAGQQAALDLLRPGVPAAELFHAAVAATRRCGIPHYARTHVGHGIGLIGGYDGPLLAPANQCVVEEGMVLCVETPYYELGFGGVQIEDMVLVTGTGWEPLSFLPRGLEQVG